MAGFDEVAYYAQPTVLFRELSAPKTYPPETRAAVVTSPILELLFFHKAIRIELDHLYKDALAVEKGSEREFQALFDRYEFLRVVYTEHSNAEDEVIFPALDSRVKNIAKTYSLEHKEESELFDKMFNLLNSALKEESSAPAKLRMELICCTEAMQTSLCKHLSKEEEQVFPLLIQHFSFKEQARLVWQFMCSIPVKLMEEFLPWILSCLSREECVEMITCMHKVVPKERLLRQVVFAWLKGGRMQVMDKLEKTDGEMDMCRSYSDLLEIMEDNVTEPSTSEESQPMQLLECNLKMLYDGIDNCFVVGQTSIDVVSSNYCPLDMLLFWHKAIMREIRNLASETRMLQLTTSMIDVELFSERLRFLSEVCKLHSAAEDKVLFPAIEKKAKQTISFRQEHIEEQQLFDDIRCLVDGIQGGLGIPDIKDKLRELVDSFVVTMEQHLASEESEVIPIGRDHFGTEEQRVLMYECLRIMPLKLLEMVLPWLVTVLNEEETKNMLKDICLAAQPRDAALVTLLLGWACKGQIQKESMSGHCSSFSSNSTDNCLIKKLSRRNNRVRTECGVSVLDSFQGQEEDLQSSDGRLLKRIKHSSSMWEQKASDLEAIHPECLLNKKSCCVPGLGVGQGSFGYASMSCRTSLRSSSCNPFQSDYLGSGLFGVGSDFGSPRAGAAPKPIDTIFQFHKAIRKDLEYLDNESAGLAECNEEFLRQFTGRFRLLWGLYRAHSNAEDDIVFPALESKEALHNVSHSYTIDHKHEEQLFQEISNVLCQLSHLQGKLHMQDHGGILVRYKQELATKMQGMCKSVRVTLDQHVSREELELWPLFAIHFTVDEQEKLVGQIIGTTGAEVLQAMLPWVTTVLSEEEQSTMMSTWRHATRNTMFDKWLRAWWKGSPTGSPQSLSSEDEVSEYGTPESLQMVANYLSKGKREGDQEKEKGTEPPCADFDHKTMNVTGDAFTGIKEEMKSLHCDSSSDTDTMSCKKEVATSSEKVLQANLDIGSAKFKPGWQDIFRMNEKELEAAVRKVSGDTSLDPRQKAYLMQNLLTSRWIVAQQHSHKPFVKVEDNDIPGQSPSYVNADEGIFGCEHYKRNCKIRAACCGILFPCRFCHDKVSDHTMNRQATKEMMCMKCLCVQPVAQYCATPSCEGFCMAKYYCSICKLFDDKRDIYHCPSCNLCRVGKGLGVDFFHCMTCNACMSTSLASHKCLERGLESNCPICHDFLFTSHMPVKALPCGHFMHSSCYRAYTYSHYTCPICCKSLGEMDVYFGMLDALLASEQLPEEYKDRTQEILCHDCQQKGTAPFHWLYHKCSKCGSYNTRAL